MGITSVRHHSIKIFAGPGTIRMNLLKFDVPINKEVYMKGSGRDCVEKLLKMNINVAYSMFNWGFAPEIEKEDWESFREFAALCHHEGISVVAYVQSSNIVWRDWFRLHPESKGWLCIDKNGNSYPYHKFTGRYWCCFNNPNWIEQVSKRTLKAVEYGADGIFYDNIVLFPCYCQFCKQGFAAYLKENGLSSVDLQDIPEYDEEYDAEDDYLRHWGWFRSRAINRFYRSMKELLAAGKTKIPITSNTHCMVEGNPFLNKGYDFAEIAKIEDYIYIENPSLPRILDGGLINNACTFKVAGAYVRDKTITVDSKTQQPGLGGDVTYPKVHTPREYQLGIAEAAAWQGSFTVIGTEFFDKYWTLLTEDCYRTQHEAIGRYNRFLAEHAELYQGNRYLANIGLFHSHPSLNWTWAKSFPSFCGFFQTLYQNNIPFNILVEKDIREENLQNYELIIFPKVYCIDEALLDKLLAFVNRGGKLLVTGEFGTKDTMGNKHKESLVARLPKDERITYLKACPGWLDRGNGDSNSYWYFCLPKKWPEIVKIVNKTVKPPVIVHTNQNNIVSVWEQDDGYIIHIVNFDEKQKAQSEIILPGKVRKIEGFSPDRDMEKRVGYADNKIIVEGTTLYDVIRSYK